MFYFWSGNSVKAGGGSGIDPLGYPFFPHQNRSILKNFCSSRKIIILRHIFVHKTVENSGFCAFSRPFPASLRHLSAMCKQITSKVCRRDLCERCFAQSLTPLLFDLLYGRPLFPSWSAVSRHIPVVAPVECRQNFHGIQAARNQFTA